MENNVTVAGLGISTPAMDVKGMETGERTTVPCKFTETFKYHGAVVSADIVLIAAFRPDFVFWHIQRDFRFKTVRGSDGKLYWYPYAYDRTPEAEVDRNKGK